MARGNYKVVSGDTLSKIARDNNTTVAKLIELNPKYKENPNLIRPGQNVVLPTVNGSSSQSWATDFFSTVPQDVWQEAFIQAAEEQLGVTVDPVVEPVEDTQPVEELVEEEKPLPEGEDPIIEIDDGTVEPVIGSDPDQIIPKSGDEVDETVSNDPVTREDYYEFDQLGPVDELLADPAYRAFMASFGVSNVEAEKTMTAAYSRLLSQATRNFGYYDAPENATDKDALSATFRSGGLYDIEYDKARDKTVDQFAGRGMGFSGQVLDSIGELEETRLLGERDFQTSLSEEYDRAELDEEKTKNRLIKEKLEEEAAAYERLAIFQAGG